MKLAIAATAPQTAGGPNKNYRGHLHHLEDSPREDRRTGSASVAAGDRDAPRGRIWATSPAAMEMPPPRTRSGRRELAAGCNTPSTSSRTRWEVPAPPPDASGAPRASDAPRDNISTPPPTTKDLPPQRTRSRSPELPPRWKAPPASSETRWEVPAPPDVASGALRARDAPRGHAATPPSPTTGMALTRTPPGPRELPPGLSSPPPKQRDAPERKGRAGDVTGTRLLGVANFFGRSLLKGITASVEALDDLLPPPTPTPSSSKGVSECVRVHEHEEEEGTLFAGGDMVNPPSLPGTHPGPRELPPGLCAPPTAPDREVPKSSAAPPASTEPRPPTPEGGRQQTGATQQSADDVLESWAESAVTWARLYPAEVPRSDGVRSDGVSFGIETYATEADVRPPVYDRAPRTRQPIATTSFVATPSSMAWLGQYVEDEGDPFALTQSTPTTPDAATFGTWTPRERLPPAIVATIASSLSAVAREGHLEDDGDPPVARRWRLVGSPDPSRKHPAIVSGSVRGCVGDGGRVASAFKLLCNVLAFRIGIG